MSTEEIEQLLERVRSSAGAVTPQSVLDVVATSLADRLPLTRASIRLLVPESSMLELVAVWSPTGTTLGVGMRMSLGSTAYPAVSSTGRPEFRTHVVPEDGLLDEIMSRDGIESYVTLPLRDAARTLGLFSVSSSKPGAFAEEDLPYLEEVAKIVCLAVTKPF